MEVISVIGINEDGLEGLSERSKQIIKDSEVIFGGRRHIELVKSLIDGDKKVIIIGGDTQSVINEIKKNFYEGKKVVVLNSGDPLFFGLAKKIIDNIGKNFVEVIPALSSIQLAFSKIKENWDDAVLLSIHSKDRKLQNYINEIKENRKIAFITYGREDPKKIARFLRENKIEIQKFFVLENLGSKNEKVREINLEEVENLEFSDLNIVIILKDSQNSRITIGLDDNEFEHISGLITKSEIRAIVLSKLSLSLDSVVWDIGGGSGSVSIECASIARKGRVFCIEKNEKSVEIIKRNVQKFCLMNLEILHGKAPQILSELPDPNSVFIGGGGDEIEDILSECFRRKPISIVCTFVDIFHLTRALNYIKEHKREYNSNVLSINIMKLKEIESYHKFDMLTSVFLLHLTKKTEGEI